MCQGIVCILEDNKVKASLGILQQIPFVSWQRVGEFLEFLGIIVFRVE
jgi:hypothetical protein